MALLAEHVPEHGREPVGLEGKPHLICPLDDEILGLAGGRDTGEVTLDVGGEHGDAGAGKAFGHHLQRHRLAGAGGAGDEAMPVGQRERQPGRLLALPDKDLLRSIGQLVVGPGHRIASSRKLKGFKSIVVNHTASCNAIETGQSPLEGIERAAR